ncbi:MAG: alpha/beta fold hydrolase [Pyrinomonadaceae bacterium]|nr:alpha/beta fold hydrolase [Pyrinomonadaceae bacterium]
MSVARSELSFSATPEKGQVSAICLLPANATHLLVLGHGAGADMRSMAMQNIAAHLAERGIATLRYNFPFKEYGRGGIDSPKTATATVRAAVAEARRLKPKLTLLAGGHSFGGRMTTTAQSESPLDGVKGLVLFSFPLHAPNRPDDSRAEHLYAIRIPMLFLTGTRDALNDLDLFRPVIKKLGNRATLHLLDTADHSYKVLKKTRTSTEDVFAEMARVTADWANGLSAKSS